MSTKRDTLILERRFFPEGGIIINEGEDGDVAYLIQSGTIEIFKTLNGKQMPLAEMEAGDIFGEMTLLFEQKRTAMSSCSEFLLSVPVPYTININSHNLTKLHKPQWFPNATYCFFLWFSDIPIVQVPDDNTTTAHRQIQT